MTKEITELTPEQEQQLDVYADRWINIGLNTEEADFDEAKFHIERIYDHLNMTRPKIWRIAQSPFAAIDQMSEEFGGARSDHIPNMRGNQEWWLSYYEYWLQVLNIQEAAELQPYFDLARICGWWTCYDEAVMMCNKPSEIHLDDQNQLHNPAGFAVAYRDGHGVTAWHGQLIPDGWLQGKLPAAGEILQWPNAEQRRCACEIAGWGAILDEVGARVIDEDQDPTVGTLLEAEIPDSGIEKFLRVREKREGDSREFVLCVPRECKTALEANASTYDVPEDVIRNLEIRV